MDRLEIVAYRANVCVDLSGPTRYNGLWAMVSIYKGENHYKTGRQEVDSLAYLGPKTVQTMGGSSEDRIDAYERGELKAIPGQEVFRRLKPRKKR